MCFQPQRASANSRIDTGFFPPRSFVTAMMDFAVMPPAERDGELVADFAAKRPGLRKSQVVASEGCRPQMRHGRLATTLT
jgi:hypothetical protein